MGDFERTFGAGADVDSIIRGYSSDFLREQRGADFSSKPTVAQGSSTYDRAEGREVRFSCYEDMKSWDARNPNAQYVRRRSGDSFIMKVVKE